MKKLTIAAAFLFAATGVAIAQSGKITGKLTYPSDGIPSDMVLCLTVTSLSGEPTYCSNAPVSKLKKAKIAFSLNRGQARYSVTLPAGSYYIYARTAADPGRKAYYDEFVKCGMSIECTSKTPILINVKAGQTRSGITVGDFWD